MTSPLWWHRRGETWRMPEVLTEEDKEWIGGNLERAGWRCDDPPPNAVAAFCVNAQHLMDAFRPDPRLLEVRYW